MSSDSDGSTRLRLPIRHEPQWKFQSARGCGGLNAVIECGLGQHGHEAIVELSAEQVLDQRNRSRLEVVVSDLGFGTGMSGWEPTERVREQWPSTRFVRNRLGRRARLPDARLHGVDAVVAKPYRAAALVADIDAS